MFSLNTLLTSEVRYTSSSKSTHSSPVLEVTDCSSLHFGSIHSITLTVMCWQSHCQSAHRGSSSQSPLPSRYLLYLASFAEPFNEVAPKLDTSLRSLLVKIQDATYAYALSESHGLFTNGLSHTDCSLAQHQVAAPQLFAKLKPHRA